MPIFIFPVISQLPKQQKCLNNGSQKHDICRRYAMLRTFLLYPLKVSVELIFEYFSELGLSVVMETNHTERLIYLLEDYSKDISVKVLSKYLQ